VKSLISSPGRVRTLAVYSGMLGATIALYLWIRGHGEELVAGVPPLGIDHAAAASHSSVLANVLLALAVVTLLARVVGGLFRRYLGQPAVIGEIVAGLLLGPSVLGALSPELYEALLPAGSASYLGLVSKVGVVLFMFLVGLELDPKLLRGSTHATVVVSHASILAPFLLGAALALWLYPRYSASDVSFTVFSLFLGVSLSVTAFPVLARILTDRGVQRTRLAATALTCAAVDDVSAWMMLALVAGIASSSFEGAAWTVPLVLLYLAVMVLVVRPLSKPFVRREQAASGPLSHGAFAVVLVSLLLSAVATEAIGIHALFGAFLLGALLPHDGRLPEQIRMRLEDVVVVLFLPSFFAFTGMRTEIGLLGGAYDWLACGLVVVVATAGKFGGTLAAARLVGLSWRHSSALGVLMNTRGLMELIVLNLGLDLGVITPTVFTMMVLMALVTTFATTPVLDLILGQRGFADEPPPK
jgi:Kef-type K+ transport system membrane component KefB